MSGDVRLRTDICPDAVLCVHDDEGRTMRRSVCPCRDPSAFDGLDCHDPAVLVKIRVDQCFVCDQSFRNGLGPNDHERAELLLFIKAVVSGACFRLESAPLIIGEIPVLLRSQADLAPGLDSRRSRSLCDLRPCIVPVHADRCSVCVLIAVFVGSHPVKGCLYIRGTGHFRPDVHIPIRLVDRSNDRCMRIVCCDIQSDRSSRAYIFSGQIVSHDPLADIDVRSGGCELVALFLCLADVLLIRSLCLRVLGIEHIVCQRIAVRCIRPLRILAAVQRRVDKCRNFILRIRSAAGKFSSYDRQRILHGLCETHAGQIPA